jgi:hypothetical protein
VPKWAARATGSVNVSRVSGECDGSI